MSLMFFLSISRTTVNTKRDHFASTVTSIFGYSKKLLMTKTDAYDFIEGNFFFLLSLKEGRSLAKIEFQKWQR